MLDIKVTLRLSTKNYSLEQIGKALGKPTKGFSVGDEYGREKKKRDFTLWSLESKREASDDFESHLQEILTFLDENYHELEKLIDYEVDLFCMLSTENGQGGASLKAETMRRLSEHNVSLVFDVYG